MDNKVELARKILKFVIGTSVGGVVSSAVKNISPTENKTQEVKLVVGAFVLGSIAADRALDWFEPKFDDIVEQIRNFKNPEEQTEEK